MTILSSDVLRIGIDVGSTTVKLLALDSSDQLRFSVYRRHHSDVRATVIEIVEEALAQVGDVPAAVTITGWIFLLRTLGLL